MSQFGKTIHTWRERERERERERGGDIVRARASISILMGNT